VKDHKQPGDDSRQSVTLPTMIHCGAGQSPVQCTVRAISDVSARLSVTNPDSIPDTFTLSFAGATKVLRRCTVVTRESDQIIVEMAR
jgi:hypothetical protein